MQTEKMTLLQSILDTGVNFISGVPDSEFKELIRDLESPDYHSYYVSATREDHAVALGVGAHLAGNKPLIFMESSGLGNCVDVLTSLVNTYSIPMVLLVAWAGYQGRDVSHHNAIGENLLPLLESIGVTPFEVAWDRPEEVNRVVAEGVKHAERTCSCVAVLGIPVKLKEGRV